jgi:hypothetical protein
VKAGADYAGVTVVTSGSGAMTAATEKTFNVSGLTADSDYDLHLVAQDGSSNANFSNVEQVRFSTLPNSHAITTATIPSAGGSASCDPNPVNHGSDSSCTATANAGYSFANWSGDCSGASCALTNVTAAKSVTANFEAMTSYTAPSPTGSGDVTLAVDGAGCTLTSAQFVAAPAGMPANMDFPHGLADFTLTGCASGATVTITYPTPIAEGATYWKEIEGTYVPFSATLAGNSATFSLIDNGSGDDNPAVGIIHDPSGVALAAAAAPAARSIPTLGPWALSLLVFALGIFGVRLHRKG